MKKITIIVSTLIAVSMLVGFSLMQADKNKFIVVIKPQSNFVMLGDKYSAEIYLAKSIPSSTEVKTTLKPGTNEKIDKQQDKILYSAITNTEGLQTFSGSLNIKNNNGTIESLPFETSFMVTKPTASIMTKYLIKGIENPLYIGVSGIPAIFLKAESSNGNISGNNGTFKVIPATTGKCKITVKADIGGSIKIIESHDFEVVEKK